MKYIGYVRSRFSKVDFPVFMLEDLRLALKSKSIKDDYLRLMVHELCKRGEATRITRGVYTFHDDSAVVGFAFRPFYYGLENALSLHGLSEQGTNFIVMTPRNVRGGVRSFKGRNYRIRRIRPERLFGYQLMRHNGFWIPVSDVEKTVIDMLYFNDMIRDELLPAIAKGVDRNRFASYLQRYDPAFRKKSADFLATVPHARRREGERQEAQRGEGLG